MKLIFALLFVEIGFAASDCDKFWTSYESSCYWFSGYIWRSWSKAREYCKSQRGDLVRIDNDGEQTFITREIRTKPYPRWIGLQSGSYKNWATGEPNYSGSGKACVAVKNNGEWFDDTCDSAKMYICEKPAEVDECSADPGPCDINADCTNTVDSYTCKCKTGFTGNGKTCAVKWEPKGCYRDRKKNIFVKSFFSSDLKTIETPPETAFELCRNKAEGENFEVIAIGTEGKGKERKVVCLTTENGRRPYEYGIEKENGCKIENRFGMGMWLKMNYIYIKPE